MLTEPPLPFPTGREVEEEQAEDQQQERAPAALVEQYPACGGQDAPDLIHQRRPFRAALHLMDTEAEQHYVHRLVRQRQVIRPSFVDLQSRVAQWRMLELPDIRNAVLDRGVVVGDLDGVYRGAGEALQGGPRPAEGAEV